MKAWWNRKTSTDKAIFGLKLAIIGTVMQLVGAIGNIIAR